MIYALDKKGSTAQNTKTAVFRFQLPLVAAFCALAFLFASCDTGTNDTAQTGKPDPTGITLSYTEKTILTVDAAIDLPTVASSTAGSKNIKGTKWAVKSGSTVVEISGNTLKPLSVGVAVLTVTTTTPTASQDVTITVRAVSHITLSDAALPSREVYGVGELYPVPDSLTYTYHYTSGDPGEPRLVTPDMISKLEDKTLLAWNGGDTGTGKVALYVYDRVTGKSAPLGTKKVHVNYFVLNVGEDFHGHSTLLNAVNAVLLGTNGHTATITQYQPDERVTATITLTVAAGMDRTIILKGYKNGTVVPKITQAGAFNQSIFTINPAGTVTLILGENITLEGRKTTTNVGFGENTAPVVQLTTGGARFVMKDDSQITGWTGGNISALGVLYVQNGIATIDGGKITGNTIQPTTLPGTFTAIPQEQLGFVIVNGSAANRGRLVMNGGSISGNGEGLEFFNDVLVLTNNSSGRILELDKGASIGKLGVRFDNATPGAGASLNYVPVMLAHTWQSTTDITLNVGNINLADGTINAFFLHDGVALFSGSVEPAKLNKFKPGRVYHSATISTPVTVYRLWGTLVEQPLGTITVGKIATITP